MTESGLAPVIMVMGTSSSAGKSLIATALCRCLSRRGFSVAPFKAQNLSNNSAVCSNGGEIGRSQALQALACGTEPHPDMNPILLKPEGGSRSQLIIQGELTSGVETRDYFRKRERLWPVVTDALDRLRADYGFVVIEGAGSPAELNLVETEIVNMSVARYCQAPVILVGDIERGGVFAQLLGTLWLLDAEEQDLIAGFIVNKFHGDLSLFERGAAILEERGKVPVLGVLPWINDLHLPEEDSATLSMRSPDTRLGQDPAIDIAIIQFPHLSNFDDFDPLNAEPCVNVRYVRDTGQMGIPHVVILPGSKSTLDDLEWLRTSGIGQHVVELADRGVKIVGICGGYQMLGKMISNTSGFEGEIQQGRGLGLLNITTTFGPSKQTRRSSFTITDDRIAPGTWGTTVSGYEIHLGETRSNAGWLSAAAQPPGRQSPSDTGSLARSGQIWGCYLHGLFHNDSFRRAFLKNLGAVEQRLQQTAASEMTEQSLDRLADAFERHVDLNQLLELALPTQPEQGNRP